MMTMIRKPLLLSAAAATLAAAGLTGTARADVAAQIPGDALFFVKVNDLRGTSDRLAQLANDFGIAAFNPDMGDPLGAAIREGKLTEGLDESGDAAIYLMHDGGEDEPDDEDFVVLMPTTDFEAFVGNFEGVEMNDDGSASFDYEGEQVTAVSRGGYVALSPGDTTTLMMEPGEGLTVADQSADEVEDLDVVLYVNFEKVGPMLQAAVDEEDPQSEAIEEMREEFADNEELAGLEPVAEAGIKQGFLVLTSFLRDAEATTAGISFDPDGIQVKLTADFKADSYLGTSVGSLAQSDASMLAGLPDVGPYLVYGGLSTELGPVIRDVLQPVIDASAEIEGEKGQEINEMLAGVTDIYSELDGLTFGFLAPAGDFGDAPLFQLVTIARGGEGDMLDEVVAMTENQQELMAAFGQAEAAGSTELTRDAKEVAGVSFAKLVTDVPPGPAAMFYGPEGSVQYLAQIDGQLVSIAGLGDEQMAEVVAAVQGGLDPLAGSDALQETAETLPGNRIAVQYVAADEIAKVVGDFAQQFGQPIQVQLPPNLPPLGTVVTSDGTEITVTTVLPTATVQALVAQGMQTMMQMQGGGGGGGGL